MHQLEKYFTMIDAIITVSDPYSISPKKIRKALQALFDVDLHECRKELNEVILDRFHMLQENPMVFARRDSIDSQEEEQTLSTTEKPPNDIPTEKKNDTEDKEKENKDVETDNVPHIQLRKRRSQKKPVAKKRKRPEGATGGGIQKTVLLSDKMKEFLGESAMPRTQVVKKVWEYIKSNNLQNPNNRRQIICDEKMQPIFGNKIDMFQMTKVLSQHLYNPDQLVQPKVKDEEETNRKIVDKDEKNVKPAAKKQKRK